MYFFYFYPVAVDQSTRRRPVLSYALIAVMVVVFLWFRYFPELVGFLPRQLIFYPGYGSPWTVLSSLFVHAGWFHLLGNLVYLHAFGPVLEDRLGRGPFLLYFLMIGVFGNLSHGLITTLGWLGSPGIGVLGASGAIAGFLSLSLVRLPGVGLQVAWWILAPLVGQNRAGKSRVPIIGAVGLWLLLQIAQAMASSETGAMVSFGAHLGGFAMGLFLALALGHWREGQADGMREKAQSYFRQGHFHAAAGSWTQYLEIRPADLEARLEMARAQTFGRQHDQALLSYQEVFNSYLTQKNVAAALDVYSEAQRGHAGSFLGPDELNMVAHYREKQLDFAGAVDTYGKIYEAYPATLVGQRALVRAITLLAETLGDGPRAEQLLVRAFGEFPPGCWRDYLVRNFRCPSVPDAAVGAGRSDRTG